MRLHNSFLTTNKSKGQQEQGFTLIELLIVATIGTMLTITASNTLVSQLRSGGNLAAAQSVRQEWNRTTHFIESEAALSERVITNSTKINLNQCTTAISSDEFRFALDIRRDLPLAIYYIKKNTNSQALKLKGTHSLYRCGPGINREGNYTNIISISNNSSVSTALLVDGMTSSCQINPSSIRPANSSGKSLRYELCLQGTSSNRYAQTINTYSRISPIFSYPSERSLCNQEYQTIEGFTSIAGTTGANELNADEGALDGTQSVLMCGYGGSDTLNGSPANDVLEAGNTAGNPVIQPKTILNGFSGSDRLMGANSDDTLNGGEGDDVLISGTGDDTIDGGNGDNQYLIVLPGNKKVTGGEDLDVIYLKLNKADIDPSQLSSCQRNNCELTNKPGETTYKIEAKNVEVIIFRDGRHDITN